MIPKCRYSRLPSLGAGSVGLFEKKSPKKTEFSLGIGTIAKSIECLQMVMSPENGFLMGERVKAMFPMVGAHSTISYTTER
jgi:hypothetical protein